MKQALYTCAAVQNLIDKYIQKDGIALTVNEGSLGYGDMILFGDGLKTAIIHEVYINEWNSAHTIRMYNKTPEKYQRMIDNLY